MKKYRLKLKEGFRQGKYNFKNIAVRNGDYKYHNLIWLKKIDCKYYKYAHSKDEYGSSYLTQQEIDELPYGFVKMHDVIEIGEQLYYIKLPIVSYDNKFLNEEPDGRVIVDNNTHNDRFKTVFTKSEIEEKFPMYANGYFMVRVEEVE